MSDNDYFARRADEEVAAAERATTPEYRHAHSQLAQRYLEIIENGLSMPGTPAPASDGHLSA